MKTATQQYSRHVSVPSDEGIRVDKAITIRRPVADVYAFWHRLDNLPRFMRHVDSVSVTDELHSHWGVKTVGGKLVEWDAEIIEQKENEMISWRSIPGSEVDNAGSVWFTSVPGGEATVMRVELKYIPPAGRTGAFVAKLFGRDAESEIAEDLRRVKSLLETGKLPPPEKTTTRWRQGAGQATRKAALAGNRYVHEKAWTVIASVAFGCFLLGFLAGRRSR